MTAFELTQKTRQLLRGPLKHVRKAALATALVPLGAVALPDAAYAQLIQNTSRVDATVTSVGSNFLYEFTVRNTSGGFEVLTDDFVAASIGLPVIIDWELPLFDLDDVSSIQSPFGWDYEIVEPPYETDLGPIWSSYDAGTDPLLDPLQGGDPDLYGPNPEVFENPPYVLHWFADFSQSGGAGAIFPGGFLSGFSFESEFTSRNAPYLASWSEFPPAGGDPPIPGGLFAFGTPNSPARQAAQGIPEPSSLVLLVMAGIPLLSRGRDENR